MPCNTDEQVWRTLDVQRLDGCAHPTQGGNNLFFVRISFGSNATCDRHKVSPKINQIVLYFLFTIW
jgi:hypothetical protein